MGMFDDLIIEYELPIPKLPKEGWQTKCFDCELDTFTLTREGRLLQKVWAVNFHHDEVHEPTEQKLIDRNYEGVFNFYHMVDDEWYDFEVVMVDGNVQSIKRTEQRESPFAEVFRNLKKMHEKK